MFSSFRMFIYFFISIILILILYSYAMFEGGFVSWFLFFSFIPIFLYQTFFLLYPLTKWHVTRHLSKKMIHAVESVSVVIKIQRKIPFPLIYCIYEEILPETLKSTDQRRDLLQLEEKELKKRKVKHIVFPWFRRKFEIRYELNENPRGEHHLKKIKVKSGDFFGFIKKEATYQVFDSLIVYPNEYPVKINERYELKQGSNSSPSFTFQNTNVATSVREYIPGDKLSWINWKQTAKRNKLVTKEFEREKNTDILFVFNSCQGHHLNPIAFEASIEITLSLVKAFDQKQAQVDLLSIGREVLLFSSVHKQESAQRMREHFTRLHPSSKRGFSEQLKKEVPHLDRTAKMTFITTSIDEDLVMTMVQMIGQTRRLFLCLIQQTKHIQKEEYAFITRLQSQGIYTQVLTEEELNVQPIEVNMNW